MKPASLPRIALALAFCLGMTVAAPSVWAQSAPPSLTPNQPVDPYSVTVSVDATAATAIAARDQAIASGQRAAAKFLIERMTAREDRARLPPLTDNDLRNLVRAFEVANERTSNVRYLADLTVVFNAAEVRTYLASAGVTPSGQAGRPRPVVILPVWRSADQVLLFNDRNIWFASWQQFAPSTGFVPLIVPAGDTADIAMVSPQQALTGDRRALGAIAQKYGADAVVVAIAFDEGGAAPKLTVVRFDLAEERRVALSPRPKAGGEPMQAAIAAVIAEIDENAKNQASAPPPLPKDPNQPQTQGPIADGEGLRVSVPVRALNEWIAIRNRLQSVPLIQRVDVNALVVGNADITLIYTGSLAQLRQGLATVKLVLIDQSGQWTLRADGPLLAPAGTATDQAAPAAAPPPGGSQR